MPSPAWLAVIAQVPAATRLIVKPDTVQIVGEVEVSVTVRPELAVGATVIDGVESTWFAGLVKVIVWLRSVPGVTAFDGADAGLGPTALVALTVNVYEVPLVRPVTMALDAEPAAVAVRFPGVDVTV